MNEAGVALILSMVVDAANKSKNMALNTPGDKRRSAYW